MAHSLATGRNSWQPFANCIADFKSTAVHGQLRGLYSFMYHPVCAVLPVCIFLSSGHKLLMQFRSLNSQQSVAIWQVYVPSSFTQFLQFFRNTPCRPVDARLLLLFRILFTVGCTGVYIPEQGKCWLDCSIIGNRGLSEAWPLLTLESGSKFPVPSPNKNYSWWRIVVWFQF